MHIYRAGPGLYIRLSWAGFCLVLGDCGCSLFGAYTDPCQDDRECTDGQICGEDGFCLAPVDAGTIVPEPIPDTDGGVLDDGGVVLDAGVAVDGGMTGIIVEPNLVEVFPGETATVRVTFNGVGVTSLSTTSSDTPFAFVSPSSSSLPGTWVVAPGDGTTAIIQDETHLARDFEITITQFDQATGLAFGPAVNLTIHLNDPRGPYVQKDASATPLGCGHLLRPCPTFTEVMPYVNPGDTVRVLRSLDVNASAFPSAEAVFDQTSLSCGWTVGTSQTPPVATRTEGELGSIVLTRSLTGLEFTVETTTGDTNTGDTNVLVHVDGCSNRSVGQENVANVRAITVNAIGIDIINSDITGWSGTERKPDTVRAIYATNAAQVHLRPDGNGVTLEGGTSANSSVGLELANGATAFLESASLEGGQASAIGTGVAPGILASHEGK